MTTKLNAAREGIGTAADPCVRLVGVARASAIPAAKPDATPCGNSRCSTSDGRSEPPDQTAHNNRDDGSRILRHSSLRAGPRALRQRRLPKDPRGIHRSDATRGAPDDDGTAPGGTPDHADSAGTAGSNADGANDEPTFDNPRCNTAPADETGRRLARNPSTDSGDPGAGPAVASPTRMHQDVLDSRRRIGHHPGNPGSFIPILSPVSKRSTTLRFETPSPRTDHSQFNPLQMPLPPPTRRLSTSQQSPHSSPNTTIHRRDF